MGQHRDINAGDERTERPRCGLIAWVPSRVELFLEDPQSLEIVETITLCPQQPRDPMPMRRQRRLFETGQRRHAEAQSLEAGLLEMKDHAREEESHCVRRRVRQV